MEAKKQDSRGAAIARSKIRQSIATNYRASSEKEKEREKSRYYRWIKKDFRVKRKTSTQILQTGPAA